MFSLYIFVATIIHMRLSKTIFTLIYHSHSKMFCLHGSCSRYMFPFPVLLAISISNCCRAKLMDLFEAPLHTCYGKIDGLFIDLCRNIIWNETLYLYSVAIVKKKLFYQIHDCKESSLIHACQHEVRQQNELQFLKTEMNK